MFENSKIRKKLLELEKFGKTIRFENYSENCAHGRFSETTPELKVWLAEIETIANQHYNGVSGIMSLLHNGIIKPYDNNDTLSGCEKKTFEEKIAHLMALIKLCLNTTPSKIKTINKQKKRSINGVLIGIIITLLCTAIPIAYYFGVEDSKKENSVNILQLNTIIENQKKSISEKDSINKVLLIKLNTKPHK